MKCDIHGIAAGPDGRCALCRGERRLADRHDGARLGWILFLGLGTATAALLGWHSLRPPLTHTGPDTQAEPPVAPARSATTARNDSTAPAPTQASLTAAPPSFAAPAPAVPAAPEAPAATAGARLEPSTTVPPGIAPTPSAARNAPSPEQIRATLLATPIVMYSAAWCGVCRRAEAFLHANGLRYTERDIDASPATLAELKRRTGRGAVPVLEIDGALLASGFSERSVERALVASVERRLGVRGLRLETH